jgi:hypothetical protein
VAFVPFAITQRFFELTAGLRNSQTWSIPMFRRFTAITLLVMASAVAISARNTTDGPKIDRIGGFVGPSESLNKSLESNGSRITLSDGLYCEIWLRAAVPIGKTDAPGAVYTTVGESTLVGVIRFAKATTDFRGQAIKEGSYTLRYAVHPADGNHMGISPIRDFLVMVPVASDPNPDAQFKFEELSKMSTKVSGTNHPAVLSLVSLDSAPASPKVESNEMNNVVFSSAIKRQSGAPTPIAFVVKGRAEQ